MRESIISFVLPGKKALILTLSGNFFISLVIQENKSLWYFKEDFFLLISARKSPVSWVKLVKSRPSRVIAVEVFSLTLLDAKRKISPLLGVIGQPGCQLGLTQDTYQINGPRYVLSSSFHWVRKETCEAITQNWTGPLNCTPCRWVQLLKLVYW
jgi:hypothetical protein